MNNNKFSEKYNFDLKEELTKPTKIPQINANNLNGENTSYSQEFKKNTHPPPKTENKNYDNIHFYDKIETNRTPYKIPVEKIESESDVKKIKIDNKTSHENLKRKILLNHKLVKIFIDNFYRDEFNNTRKASYCMFLIPFGVMALFSYVSPHHPFLGSAFGVGLGGSLIAFAYFFNKEITYLSHLDYSPIGRQIRMIKNELVLYNPLSKPIMDSQVIQENKKT